MKCVRVLAVVSTAMTKRHSEGWFMNLPADCGARGGTRVSPRNATYNPENLYARGP